MSIPFKLERQVLSTTAFIVPATLMKIVMWEGLS